MDLDLNEVFAAFIVESEECLGRMETGLLQLEQHPDASEAIDEVFRAAHTIKGNSSSLGFNELASFGHELEDLLHKVRIHEMRVESGLITLLLASVDAVRRWLPNLQPEVADAFDPEARSVYERLRAWGQTQDQGESDNTARERRDRDAVSRADVDTIRVQTSRMDSLLNLTGEVAIAAERVRRQTEVLARAERLNIGEAVEELERLLRDVHETVMRCRMVPIGPTFRRHRRTVRDLAAAQGKQIRLELSGEDVEVDVSVIEALSDPLVHMIRNAIDHGIEPPHSRIALGKKAVGTLTLRAFHERGSMVVQMIDDGAGIQSERVRARAISMGIPAESLTRDELVSLIFEPGFSTAENVTETSGRGVGMDVVRRNVEKVRGRVSVESVEGSGTTMTMRLPLTLAVIPGFVVSVAGEQFVIPLSEVDECIARPDQIAGEESGAGVLYVRGEGVPFVRLRDYFGFGGSYAGREVIVIVDRYSGRAGFLVDEVVGEAQIVIKPLTSMLRSLPGVSGTAVMGNGSVAMVLESGTIFKEMERVGGGLNAA